MYDDNMKMFVLRIDNTWHPVMRPADIPIEQLADEFSTATRIEDVTGLLLWEERLTGSAIMHDGVMVSLPAPARHGCVIRRICELDPSVEFVSGEQGFVTNRGKFVSREQAYHIAIAAKQSRDGKPPFQEGYLYSEDVW